ncbi:Tetratricopeptide TPR_1 repeat-containing protein [Niastella koreensis GR20-10]|uniref:Tetratricopeptide TPR_1 repeat-containing protein n=2 Tax=Niastella koreensis TaxID=354356 RepID=G8TBF3_NIAKG|nr:tetratricopeptide repeat protein [Niastella koreensis]AEW03453.1 Tetratricopeptide TPR_1 repeat-containing protein [Niastella koreensis GR20-10]
MKKGVSLFLCAITSLVAVSQNIQDAKKFIYYERYKTAEDQLQQVVKTDPANGEGWYLLSKAYLSSNDPAPLQNLLSQAPASLKEEPYFQVAYGSYLLNKGNKDSAKYYFDRALDKTREKNADILSAIANAHIVAKTGDANYAVELLNKAVNREKKDPALFTMLGDAQRKQGNGSDAYKSYVMALDKDGKHAAALYRMGKIFVSQKNPEMYLKYFNQALEADSNFAPAVYELYYHYYFTEPQKAMEYFKQYVAKSDPNKTNDVLYTDLLYLNKQYQDAITNAQRLLGSNNNADSMPRLYKLMAYSYLGLKDSANAMTSMSRYFSKEVDTNMVAKDYEVMAGLYSGVPGKEDSAIAYYLKTADMAKDQAEKFHFYKKLSELYKDQKDYLNQGKWLGMYYTNNPKATNIDLFNWGIANFKAEAYDQADTVFGAYIQKYPDQAFGYYWRARVNSLSDSTMEKGSAIPWYNKLISMIETDTNNKTNKKWLVEAYGYLAAYQTNQVKDYKSATENLKKILTVDPENKDAKQYISVLEKKIAADNSNSTTGTSK